jgi:hypothetical protein
VTWTEDRGRAELYARTGRVDEVTGGRATEASHRLARSQGGTWSPSNLLDLSNATHAWLHANPRLAVAGGWHLRSGADPEQCPVWLSLPWPGWWLIQDGGDGGPHVLVPAGVDWERPVLPVVSRATHV